MTSPLIAHLSFNLFGWGPSLSAYWWGGLVPAEYRVEAGWRYITVAVGNLEVTVQWL
jgi:hypothetical protein